MRTARSWLVVMNICIFLVSSTFPIGEVAFADEESDHSFEFGFQHRFRGVTYENLLDYSDAGGDEREFFRFRTQLWGDWKIVPAVSFKVRLTNEFRKYTTPDESINYDEIFVDTCYLELRDMADGKLSLQIGRQNIIRGDGFLLFDGSPLDGSRSIYSNAISVRYALSHGRLELLAIANPAHDRYFPRIGDQEKALIEWDEQAIGAYYRQTMSPSGAIDAYYLYKREFDGVLAGNERYINIFGGRVTHQMEPGWSVSGELAGELGNMDPEIGIQAWAGQAYIGRTFSGSAKPYLKLGLIAFSGDDPTTPDTDEGWDPGFARWPKWSELYIYSLARERGVAYWSNMYLGSVEAGCMPWKSVKLRAGYYHMEAFEQRVTEGSPFGFGANRGDNFQVRTDFNIVRGLSGHLVGEVQLPGDYYRESADTAYFVRFELCYTFARLFTW